MGFIVVSIVLILVLSGAVGLAAAFPHRHHELVRLPGIGGVLAWLAERLPVLPETHADPTPAPGTDGAADGVADTVADGGGPPHPASGARLAVSMVRPTAVGEDVARRGPTPPADAP